MKKKALRAAGIGLVVILLLLAAGAYGVHAAARALKSQIEAALGPDSEVGAIHLGWSTVEIHDLQVRAPKGWPAPHTLRAQHVTVVPDLRGWLRDRSRITVSNVTIRDAYLSVWRGRHGKLRLLPGLLDASTKVKPVSDAKSETMPVVLDNISLQGGVLELFDSSVRKPAHRIRLENLQANLQNLQLPSLSGRTKLRIDGNIAGVRRQGKLAIDGWLELAQRNSQLSTKLSGVDLIMLQPYLIKATETGVKRGTLDMTLQSTVRNNQLHAPGTVTLSDLELDERGGSFMSLPRSAVIAGMKDRNNRITVQFVLAGNLSDPKFSLNDSFAKNIGAGAAGLLGISIEGLSKSLGNAASGVGSVVKKLFGK